LGQRLEVLRLQRQGNEQISASLGWISRNAERPAVKRGVGEKYAMPEAKLPDFEEEELSAVSCERSWFRRQSSYQAEPVE
jgi:hypothetical protein